MWVKRTPAEIVEGRRSRKRVRVKSAVFFGVFVAVLTTLLMGWREATDRGRFVVPLAEIPRRLPVSLIFGVLVGLLFYGLGSRKPTVVCSKCGNVGYAGDSVHCPCGGQLEDIEEMKWK